MKCPTTACTAYAKPGAAERNMINSGAGIAPGEADVGLQRTKIMEGRVYLCDWEKKERGYRVWYCRKPSISAEAKTFDEAREMMWEQFCLKYSDGEGILEFITPPPTRRSVKSHAYPEIVTIAGNDWAEAAYVDPKWFTGGICALCGVPKGPRTQVSAVFSRIPSDAGSLTRFFTFLFCEDFLNLLSRKELSELTLQEAIRTRRAQKKFYELVGKPTLHLVAVRGASKATQCPRCHRIGLPCIANGRPANFVSGTDFKRVTTTCFTAEYVGQPQLCLARSRWTEISGSSHAKGLCSGTLYIAPPDRIVKHPKVTVNKQSDYTDLWPPLRWLADAQTKGERCSYSEWLIRRNTAQQLASPRTRIPERWREK